MAGAALSLMVNVMMVSIACDRGRRASTRQGRDGPVRRPSAYTESIHHTITAMLQRTATTRASSSRIFVVQPSSYSARNLHQFNGHPHLRSDIVIQEAPSSVSRSALRLRHTRAPLLQHLQSPSFPKHRRWQSTSSNPDPQAGRPSWLCERTIST